MEEAQGVETAAVTLHQTGKSKILVGYYVSHAGTTPQTIKDHLTNKLPSYMVPACLVPLEVMPLNQNGKINYRALPQPERHAEPEAYAIDPLDNILLNAACSVLQVPSLSIHDDFVEKGGDSISAITLSVELEQAGFKLNTSDIMKHSVFTNMKQCIETQTQAAVVRGHTEGACLPLPAQKWFFAQDFANPSHFNQAMTLVLPGDLCVQRLKVALQQLTAHHDVFKMSFADKEPVFAKLGHQQYAFSEAEFDTEEALYQAKNQINQSFDLADPQKALLSALLYRIEGHPTPYLYLCAHHLVVDGVSWRTLSKDLYTLYNANNPAYKLAAYSNQAVYAEALTRTLEAISDREIPYWLNALGPIPAYYPDTEAASKTLLLDKQTTSTLLAEANETYGTQANELLIAAFVNAIAPHKESANLLLEGHGRQALEEGISIDSTIGWFTSIFPTHLPVAKGGNLATQIKRVKEILRNVPEKGANYLNLAYSHPNAEIRNKLQKGLTIPVSFNYLGRFQSQDGWPVRLDAHSETVCTTNKTKKRIDVNCWVVDQQLHIQMEVTDSQIQLDGLAQRFEHEVHTLLAHCCDTDTRKSLTPSDLTNVTLSQQQIETFEHHLGELDDIYPATHFQRELMYFNRKNRDYQIDQVYFELSGTLHLSAFQEAWDNALERHDILRAAFSDDCEYGKPLALIPCRAQMPIKTENWACLTEEQQTNHLNTALLNERKEEINFMSPPLMRLFLADLGKSRHYMIFTFNHILFDGWSMQIFLSQVLSDYEQRIKDLPIAVATTRFAPFAHYILQEQSSTHAKTFWGNYLKEAPHNLRVPQDYPLVDPETLRIQCQTKRLTTGDTARITARAKSLNVTVNQYCQLCWAHTLGRVTQSHDVVFGTTLTKRPSEIPNVTELVGLFVATPPLRVELTGNVHSVLKGITSQSTDRNEYAFFDLNHYDEKEGPTAPFGTLFVFENYPEKQGDKNGTLGIKHLGATSGTNHQIVVCVFPGSEMGFNLFFDSTELSQNRAKEVAEQFKASLLSLCNTDQL